MRADEVSWPDCSSSHSLLEEFIGNLYNNILLPDVHGLSTTVPPILIVYLKACKDYI